MNTPEIERRIEAMELAIAAGYDAGRQSFGPGKFEGEPFYVAYYHDAVMNGFSDEQIYDGEMLIGDLFYIDPDSPDRTAFNLDADTVAIMLTNSEYGFVGVMELDAAELDAALTDSVESQIEQD